MIIVQTLDHGRIEFPDADTWETLDGSQGDEGNLSVGTLASDGEVDPKAEFARGTWLFVAHKANEEPVSAPVDYSQVHDYVHEEEDEPVNAAPEPRVWHHTDELPEGVLVSDGDYSLYVMRHGGELWVNFRGHGVQEIGTGGWVIAGYQHRAGTFTEVLP